MKLTREQFEDLTMGDLEGYKLLSDEMVDKGRWVILNTLVFEHEGELWGIDYETGATECQDVDRPDEYEAEPYEAVTVTAYRPKPKPAKHSQTAPPPPGPWPLPLK